MPGTPEHRDVTYEEIGRYHDEHIAPLLADLPDFVVARMRARYVVDVLANPSALRQIAEEVDRG